MGSRTSRTTARASTSPRPASRSPAPGRRTRRSRPRTSRARSRAGRPRRPPAPRSGARRTARTASTAPPTRLSATTCRAPTPGSTAPRRGRASAGESVAASPTSSGSTRSGATISSSSPRWAARSPPAVASTPAGRWAAAERLRSSSRHASSPAWSASGWRPPKLRLRLATAGSGGSGRSCLRGGARAESSARRRRRGRTSGTARGCASGSAAARRAAVVRLPAGVAEAPGGVFGGSGVYSFLDDVEEVELETPYGKPSAPFVIGEIEGTRVAFLPRHGRAHELPPHAIPYRANVWGMKELGVRRIIGPNASGALKAELQLGEFVVCDQFVDSTSGRADTFYDGPETTHVSAADPYCLHLRQLLVQTARELGIPVRNSGTVVVFQRPRFSTRAESRWFQDAGWDVINMTAYPEGYLARELELCYANISMVTDHDVGVEGTEPVTADEVMRVFGENNARLRELLFAVIPKIGPQPEDVCATALRGS